jgi:hypothetical protein
MWVGVCVCRVRHAHPVGNGDQQREQEKDHERRIPQDVDSGPVKKLPRPKSESLTRPFSSNKQFSSLTSRCTMQRLCT